MNKKQIYKKTELNERLPAPTFGEIMGDEEQIQNITKLHAQKLLYLIDHYGIPADHKNPWLILSLALAIDYVPGFQRESKRGGRPSKWKGFSRYKLCAAVMEKVLEGKSERQACRILCEDQDSPYHGEKLDNLWRRFKEVQKYFREEHLESEDIINYVKQYQQKLPNS